MNKLDKKLVVIGGGTLRRCEKYSIIVLKRVVLRVAFEIFL
jgi:hypothetical protein